MYCSVASISQRAQDLDATSQVTRRLGVLMWTSEWEQGEGSRAAEII